MVDPSGYLIMPAYNGLKPKVIVEENWWVLEIFKKLHHNNFHIFSIHSKEELSFRVLPCDKINPDMNGADQLSTKSIEYFFDWGNMHNFCSRKVYFVICNWIGGHSISAWKLTCHYLTPYSLQWLQHEIFSPWTCGKNNNFSLS